MPVRPLPEVIDPRYTHVRIMFETGRIDHFMDIFKYIPKSTVARDMHVKVDTFNNLLDHPDLMTLNKICFLAEIIGTDLRILMELWYQYYLDLKAIALEKSLKNSD